VSAVFDEGFARSIGVPVRAVYYGLLAGLAIAVVVSIQAVGVVLVSAMLIIPPSTALFVCKRMERVVVMSGAIGVVAGASGAATSYVFEGVSTGPAMVLIAGALFVVALLFGPRGGLVPGLLRQHARRRELAHG
jgi:manganese/zinc/iron transport system permease protein